MRHGLGLAKIISALVELVDRPIEVRVNECETGARSPVTEQAILDMFGFERFTKQRIGLQIDHAEREVVARRPKCVSLSQLIGRKGRSFRRDRGAGRSVGAECSWVGHSCTSMIGPDV